MQLLISAQVTIVYIFLWKEVLCPGSLCNNSIYNVIFWLFEGTVETENLHHENQGHFQG